MIIPIIILAIVFTLIAVRQIGNIKLQIWQIMLFGAIAVLITGQITFLDSFKSINLEIMLFLFSMFIIGTALEESGYLSHLSYKIFKKAKNTYLFLPTIINLFFAFLLIKLFYKEQFNKSSLNHSSETIKDSNLAYLSKISLGLLLILILIKIIVAFLNIPIDFKLVYITLISALPILIFSQKRILIIKKVDWHTLIFFASMFVLMECVWNTGFFQLIIANLNINILSIPMILAVSVLLSQLISNVPLVALYLPILSNAGATTTEMMALAAGSTIAGNLLILGAASNIIIIQNAEKKSGETITFLEFAKIGIPMTIINILIYWFFFII